MTQNCAAIPQPLSRRQRVLAMLEGDDRLASLFDCIHDGLPKEEAKAFAGRCLEFILDSASLSNLYDRFACWLLTDSTMLPQYATDPEREIIARLATLFAHRCAGDEPKREEWKLVADAAKHGRREYSHHVMQTVCVSAAREMRRATEAVVEVLLLYLCFDGISSLHDGFTIVARISGRKDKRAIAIYSQMRDKFLELLACPNLGKESNLHPSSREL